MKYYRYRLKKKNYWNFYLRPIINIIINNLQDIGFLLFFMFVFYIIYYYIFFLFIGKCNVDVVIGFSIFLLFFLLYKKGRRFIYNYVWSLTKNLYLNFVTLNKLLVRFRVLIYRYNRVYLYFFNYTFLVLKVLSKSMSLIYNKLSLMLVDKYLTNLMYNRLNLKLYYIITKTNDLPIEYIITNNLAIYELNIFLAYDILFFLL